MTLFLALLQAAATASAPDEAHRLGARLARTGTVAALLPMVARKDTEELIAAHPELAEADRARLRASAARTFEKGMVRIETAFADAYAGALSVEELRALVAAAETPAARHQRAVMPQVLVEALGTLGALDFKKDVRDAFCRETGRLCDSKANPAPR